MTTQTDDRVHVSCATRNNEIAMCGTDLIGLESTQDPMTCPACIVLVKAGECPQCGVKAGPVERVMRMLSRAVA